MTVPADPMATTVEEIRGRVRAEGLLGDDGSVLVMLSGGRDSVCLLDVAVAVCGSGRVSVLHVNYGLRADADADELHCRALCERLGVPLRVERAARSGDSNLHAWAREVRYASALAQAERLDGEAARGAEMAVQEPIGKAVTEGEEVRGDCSYTSPPRPRAVIAVGHTATDQAETVLYRLAASPGRRALLGMAPREGRVVRPLLGVTREHTAAYCRERGLDWREDLSNDDPRYARARVRHGLLQALLAVHPGALENVLRTARLLREETELLDGLVEQELGGRDAIAIERLRELPAALRRLVVIRLAERATGAFVPQAGWRVGEILELAGHEGRAELHVGGLAGAVVEDGVLRMTKIAPRAQHPPGVAPAQHPPRAPQ